MPPKEKTIPAVSRVPVRAFRSNLSTYLAAPHVLILTNRERGEGVLVPVRQSYGYGAGYRDAVIEALEAALEAIRAARTV